MGIMGVGALVCIIVVMLAIYYPIAGEDVGKAASRAAATAVHNQMYQDLAQRAREVHSTSQAPPPMAGAY
jgi:hypothetical protein